MKVFTLAIILTCSISVTAQWTSKEVIATDSTSIRYYTKGKGRPVLLIPGGPGFNGKYLFSAADTLAASGYSPGDIQYFIPDLRGTGSSLVAEGREDRITFDKIISDLELIRKNENLANWIVVGHSYGGLVSQYYVRLQPDAVRGLVLISSVSPAGFWASNIHAQKSIRLRENELLMLDKISDQLRKGPDEKLKEAYDRIMLPVYLGSRSDTTNTANALAGTKMNMRCFNAMLDNEREPLSLLEENISHYKGPVLILHGRMDPTGEGQAYENQKLLPQADLVFINRAGHFLWVENSTLFNIHCWSFLNKIM